MSIILGANQDKYQVKFLRILCERFQQNFDIAPEILSSLVNDEEFVADSSFITKQNVCKMRKQITDFKKGFNDIIASNPQPSFDTCGEIKKINKNGFVEYCNIHKYLHDVVESHKFVKKSSEQELTEYYYRYILNIFQNYMNTIYLIIERLFLELIHSKYRSIMISTDRSMLVLDAMRENPSYFKSRNYYMAPTTDKYFVKVFIPK